MHAFHPTIDDAGNNLRPAAWYRQLWPWLLMLGPATVLVAGSFTCWLAFARQDALVVDDYYKQGRAINQDLRRDRMATRLGLQFSGRYDPASARLHGTLQGFGVPLTDAVVIHLIHPTQPDKDVRLTALTDIYGKFSVALPQLDRSRWQIQIENAQRDWRLDGIWQWPQQRSVMLKADLPAAD